MLKGKNKINLRLDDMHMLYLRLKGMNMIYLAGGHAYDIPETEWHEHGRA